MEPSGDDHAPVTRGRMRTQYPLPHGPGVSSASSPDREEDEVAMVASTPPRDPGKKLGGLTRTNLAEEEYDPYDSSAPGQTQAAACRFYC